MIPKITTNMFHFQAPRGSSDPRKGCFHYCKTSIIEKTLRVLIGAPDLEKVIKMNTKIYENHFPKREKLPEQYIE